MDVAHDEFAVLVGVDFTVGPAVGILLSSSNDTVIATILRLLQTNDIANATWNVKTISD